MMSFLPENTLMGQLELVETYVFYDMPVLFAAQNTFGQRYLAVLEDDDDEVTTWLYVAMSKIRYEHVRSGVVDLYSAFVLAEDGVVYEVKQKMADDQVIAVSALDASKLSQDRLPMKGQVLELETPSTDVSTSL